MFQSIEQFYFISDVTSEIKENRFSN